MISINLSNIIIKTDKSGKNQKSNSRELVGKRKCCLCDIPPLANQLSLMQAGETGGEEARQLTGCVGASYPAVPGSNLAAGKIKLRLFLKICHSKIERCQ